MNEKRSIQDIIPPARSKPIRSAVPRPEPSQETTHTMPPQKPPRMPKVRGKGMGKFGFIGIILAVVIVVGVAFGVVSTVFHRANITVTLQTFIVPIAQSFEAAPNGALLSFSNKQVSESLNKTVPRSGSEHAEERASGTITVFNAYSKSSQRLITNTRFENSAGLIYRIKSSLVVPGYTTDSNGKVVPGQIDVTVYADEPGEKYNIGPSDFTIPGLKGSSQFDTMYASSQSPISGGFVGDRAIVSPEVRDAAIAELKSELDRTVRTKMEESIGADEIFFPDTITVTFIEEPDKTVDNGALVQVTAQASAPVFSDQKLAAVIAKEGGVTYDNPLTIENKDQLSIAVTPSTTEGNLTLTVSGNVVLVGAYDQMHFLQDLAGKDRRSVGVVLSGYPAVADLKISVYPFWRNSLPEDTAKLNLKVQDQGNPQ